MKLIRTFASFVFLCSSLTCLAGLEHLSLDNPLYPYALSEEGKVRVKFEVPYTAVVNYYEHVASGLISLTSHAGEMKLKDRYNKSFDMTLSSLRFGVNLDNMTITPVEKVDPEILQDMFNFNADLYVSKSGEKDFVSAKYKEFSQVKFNDDTQYYSRNYLHLSDWRSLNHPPIKEISDYKKFLNDNDAIPDNSSLLTDTFNREMDKISGSELTRGNTVKLLVNGLSFQEKLRQVKNAKKSIYVGVMTFAADPSSFELIDALVVKAKEGVDVQVMVEKLWTILAFRKTLHKFSEAGIKLIMADDMIHLKSSKRALFHNKIWIFDEVRAIVGGQNIVNSANNATGFNHWNKEIDILVEGPMATDVLGEFITLKKRYDRPTSAKKIDRYNLDQGTTAEVLERNFNAARIKEINAGLRGQENYEKWFSRPETARNGVCRFVIQGPQKDMNALSKTYINYFKQAQDQIYFASHRIDFELDRPADPRWETRIFNSLFDATDRGIKVKLITNGIDGGFAEIGQNIAAGNKSPRREKKNARRFARQIKQGKEPATFLAQVTNSLALKNTTDIKTYVDEAVRHENFNVWMHFQFIHSKTIIVDNILTGIGSFNFEAYSAEHSHESSVFCFDEALSAEYKKDHIRDIVNSVPVIRHEDRMGK
jgi:phosphatidylserine/phosphatidylglycerophosphate/cardiolipin synthase-like enzyme